MESIRVLIADDETMFRRALAELLNAERDIEVVAEAPNGEAAVVMAREQKPDVVLMDIKMPKMDGIEATRQIKDELPESAVVILTVYDDDENLFGAIHAGAIGYVLKDDLPEQTTKAIRFAAQGDAYVHEKLLIRVLEEIAELIRIRGETRKLRELLSDREFEVFELVIEGLKNREIAERLGISEKTVKNHVTSLLWKLDARDRIQVIRDWGHLGVTRSAHSPGTRV